MYNEDEKYYDDYEEPEDLTERLVNRTTNADQADAEDIAEEAALNGDYDDKKFEDDIDIAMDADEDMDAEADIDDLENSYAKMILEQCVGVDTDNKPKATIAISLTMENIIEETSKAVATAAFCSAPIEINSRHRFIEVIQTYPSSASNDLKVLWAHLEKYGTLLNKQSADDTELPSFKMYIVPHSALGSCFINGCEPVYWGLTSSKPGAVADQIRVLFDAEFVDFYETDDIDIKEIEAETQRALEVNAESYYEAEKYERERAEQIARNNATIENLKKGGMLK